MKCRHNDLTDYFTNNSLPIIQYKSFAVVMTISLLSNALHRQQFINTFFIGLTTKNVQLCSITFLLSC